MTDDSIVTRQDVADFAAEAADAGDEHGARLARLALAGDRVALRLVRDFILDTRSFTED